VAKQQAQAATRAKSDFLANMSHEVRTPMNAIVGMTELALMSDIHPTTRRYIENVQRSAVHLTRIINDILDFSKVEAGKLVLVNESFRLDDCLSSVVGMLESSAQVKGLSLQVTKAAGLPELLNGDELRLKQVLINLINNAVKFTERGDIVVGVEEASRAGEAVVLHFWVRDSGIGMKPQELARLFQSSSQADTSINRKYGGSGLGLAISRQLVDLMGGHIWVESQPGVGSTFHFDVRLELHRIEAASAPEQPPRHGSTSAEWNEILRLARERLSGAKLLVVDDIEVNRDLAIDLLRRGGVDAVAASDGREALAALQRHPDIDGVLMDCQMPVMDGYAATLAIRDNPATSGIPVIAVTAYTSPAGLQRALDAGMNDHVAKPLDIGNLFAILARWIRPGRPTAGGASDAGPSEGAGPVLPMGIPGINIDDGLRTTAGNRNLYLDLLQRFRVDQAGWEGQFRAARQSSDPQAATRLAHSVKSVARAIGAHGVADAATRLEAMCLEERTDAAVEASLSELLSALNSVLAGLDANFALHPPEPADRPPAAVASPQRFNSLIAQLRERLMAANPEAADTLAELRTLRCEAPWTMEALAKISACVHRFDFRSALKTVAEHGPVSPA
jgi:two-component system, sensor histidine kinase and response regulator